VLRQPGDRPVVLARQHQLYRCAVLGGGIESTADVIGGHRLGDGEIAHAAEPREGGVGREHAGGIGFAQAAAGDDRVRIARDVSERLEPFGLSRGSRSRHRRALDVHDLVRPLVTGLREELVGAEARCVQPMHSF
jgi:hypothetical protein